MQTKFKQGDKVIVKETSQIGTIKDVYPLTIEQVEKIYGHCPTGCHYYIVELEDGSTAPILEGYLADPTTAFLTELQALMRKYDAEIYGNYIDETMGVCIGNEDLTYNEMGITPDNIFDYENS